MEKSGICVHKPGGYYPNHLTHGLLAAHCAKLTEYHGSTNGKLESVQFSEDHLLFQEFRKVYNLSINDYIRDWQVLKVVDVVDSGYLGIIYENERLQHLVVAHRSTNLELSLKLENRQRQTSVHQDIEGVLLGNITLHQANGYLITAKVVDLIHTTHKNYSLSFAGHSLGAWLAELSVLYCHDSLNFAYSHAVTFDGPGSLEMMQTLRSSDIKGPVSSDKCKLEDLDIISYLSAPNVVNCANKHVGTVYRIFPENTEDALGKKLPAWCVNIKFLKSIAVKMIPLGHSLQYILPHFNPESGKPTYYKQVEKWPSITYDSFSKYSCSNLITTTILTNFRSTSAKVPKEMKLDESGINVENKAIFPWNHITLDSIVHLVLIFFKGKINLQQFWLVHEYLNKDCGFVENPQNEIDVFFLQYKAQYKVSDVDPWSRKKTGDRIDTCLKALESNKNNIQGQVLRDIVDKYHYEKYNQMFVINKQCRNSYITMEYVRNMIKEMCRTDPDFKSYVNNIGKIRLADNIGELILKSTSKPETGPIFDLFTTGYKVIIIKGMTGRGKTTLAKAYAKEHQRDCTSRLILANSKNTFEKSLSECSKSLTRKLSGDNYRHDSLAILKEHLDSTKQQILFILDNVNNFSMISSFLELFGNIKTVKVIITTQNDKLVEEKGIPEIAAEYSPNGAEKTGLLAKIKSILESLIPEGKSERKHAGDVIKFISFVKSGALSENELIHCLQINDSSKVSGTLKSLKNSSLLTVDAKSNICMNALVQNVALEISNCESACDLLQFVSSFGSQNVILSSILSKLMSFDLEGEHEKIIQLESIVDMDKKCNMQNIVNYLLEENSKSTFKTNENFKFLKRLNAQLVDVIDRKLQPLMTNIVDGWTFSQKNNSTNQFLTGQKEIIVEFLRTFTNFQNRVNHECTKLKVVKEFTNCKHVFVIGPTGSGKSTVINFLIGNELECVQVGRNGSETKINVISSKNNSVATIGNTLNSQTDSIRPYFNKRKNIVYWDFPGFFDTRGDIQKIQHAFLLKSFSESLTNSKILLVVESSSVSTIRGENFINLLSKLNQLCSMDKFQNGMSLLVTKCDPFDSEEEREADKRYFLKIFANIFESRRRGLHTGILDFFKGKDVLLKMALIPKVTKKGLIAGDFFQGLDSAIGASKFENIIFSLNFDDDAILKIIHLGEMLNSFAEFIILEVVNNRIRNLKSEILKETFSKDQLSKIQKFPEGHQFNVRGFREITGDRVQANILTKINGMLHFFHFLNCNSFANIAVWLAPLAQFNFNYDQLIRPAMADFNESGILNIEAPILSSSDVQELYNKRKSGINSVKVLSLVFIIDQDLDLPGVDLTVSSLEWRIIGRRVISLVGKWGGDRINSGNFYGYAKNISGGKVSFVLDGVDGEDGEFDPSKSVQISDCQQRIEQLKNQISSIEKLRTFSGLSLDSHKEYLKNEVKYSKERLNEVENELIDVKKRFGSGSWSQTKNKDLQRKTKLEKDIETQSDKLQAEQQDLAVVEKLMELISIQETWDAIPKQYSTIKKSVSAVLDIAVDPNKKADITKEVRKLRQETQELSEFIENLLGQQCANKSKFRELNNALEKAKSLHSCLRDFASEQNKDYSTWHSVFQDAERKLSQKHSIFINGCELELSAKELNEILNQKNSEMQRNLEKNLKSENKKLKEYMKQIIDSKDHIVRFNKQHQRRNDYKAQRDKKYKYMVELREQLRKNFPVEFSILDERIEQVRKATITKEKWGKYFDEVIGKMDGPADVEVRSNRELLRPVSKSEYAKNFKKQIANLENKHSQQKCDKLIAVLKQHAEINTKLELLELKKYSNKLVEQYQLDRNLLHEINEGENDLKAELDCTRKKLKQLCSECDIFSDYINSNVLSDEQLDGAIQMQYVELENLQKKLDYAKQHKETISDALEKFTRANDEYKTAKKNYDKWKQNHRVGEAKLLDYFLKIYEEFLECDKNWRSSFEVEAKIAAELLLKPSNLVSRKERKWDDRNLSSKTTYVFRELFIFTRQYHEKYVISGSEGFPGSNSGGFEFRGDKAHIGNISQIPGQGGQHACVLEGMYANEYSFPFLRRIQQKLGDENISNEIPAMGIVINTVGVVGTARNIILSQLKNAATAASASLQALQISGFVITAISVLASPIVATLWSHWSQGPYKYHHGAAANGEQRKIDKHLQQQSESEFSSYLHLKLQQDLQSLLFNHTLKH